MALLNRNQILAHTKLRQKTVSFPELGGEILFQELPHTVWEDFDRNSAGYALRLFMAGAIDETGRRLFPNQEDANLLAAKGASLIEKGARAVLELNGVLPESKEEILKNSPARPTAPATGGSPSPSAAPGANSTPR